MPTSGPSAPPPTWPSSPPSPCAGSAFYRLESAQGRDLAVLAAAIHKRAMGRLRVLDCMAGSGVRGLRYMAQAGADRVW